MQYYIGLAIQLYKDNEKLTIALTCLIIGWILNKFLPYIWSMMVMLVSSIGHRIGGKFGYLQKKSTFMNWVVLLNQDLHLTGIIASGEKPKLEQIFISLEVIDKNAKDEKSIDRKSLTLKGIIISLLYRFMSIFSEYGIFHPKFDASIKKDYKAGNVLNIYENTSYFTKLSNAMHDIVRYHAKLCYYILLFACLVMLPLYVLFISIQPSMLLTSLWISAFMGTSIGTAEILVRNPKNMKARGIILLYSIPLGIATGIDMHRLHSDGQNITPLLYPAILVIVFSILTIIYKNKVQFRPKRAQRKQRLDLQRVLDGNDYIAILGKPGSGKSTLIQFIALTFAQEQAGKASLRRRGVVKDRLGLRKWYFPIHIPLRKISSFLLTSSTNSEAHNLLFEAFRQNILPSDIRDSFTDVYIRHLLKKKKCIFLLDGLDEVANDEEFLCVVKEINGLVSMYEGNKFIITSRYSGWRGGVGSSFVRHEINELNYNQISVFINSWYQAIEENRSQIPRNKGGTEQAQFIRRQASNKAHKLLEALKSSSQIMHLARNPLLLSMICFVHYNKTLPKERLSLYEDCSKLLLEQWDVEKGMPKDDISLQFRQKEALLYEIAYCLHTGQIGVDNERKEATSKEILPIIEKQLKKFRIDIAQSEQLFNKLVDRTGLLICTERYKDRYSFSHLTFQEYYTAKYIHENRLDIFSIIQRADKSGNDKLSTWWREVIVLYSMMQGDASPTITALCKLLGKDIFNRPLQIAAQCFSDSLAAPSQESEKRLFDNLLSVRTCGKKNDSETLGHDIKKYLIDFTTTSRYLELSLISSWKKVFADSSVISNISKEIINLISSSNYEIRKTTLIAANELGIKDKLKDMEVDNSIFIEIIENSDIFLRNLTIQFLSMRRSVSMDSEFAKRLSKIIFERLAFSEMCSVVPILKSEAFSMIHKELQLWIAVALRHLFRCPFNGNEISGLDYRYYGSMYSLQYHYIELVSLAKSDMSYNLQTDIIPLLHTGASWPWNESELIREHLVVIFMGTLVALDSQNEKADHKMQLLQLLQNGRSDQQRLAILCLKKYFSDDSDVIEAILRKTKSYYSHVRLTAIAAIRGFRMRSRQSKKIIAFLSAGFVPIGRSKRILNNCIEFLSGHHMAWVGDEERLQILGALCFLKPTVFYYKLREELLASSEESRESPNFLRLLLSLSSIIKREDIVPLIEHIKDDVILLIFIDNILKHLGKDKLSNREIFSSIRKYLLDNIKCEECNEEIYKDCDMVTVVASIGLVKKHKMIDYITDSDIKSIRHIIKCHSKRTCDAVFDMLELHNAIS
ncbi:MAG: NACHT domain-containing protein [Desulfobacteraceae bacterium]|nr:NACHT domain-containing protein [Desulfobacteraceae bacterium]